MTSLCCHYDVVDLSRYVEELQQSLLIAAEAGGDEARELAERLVAPLQSAARLVLLDALAAAAGDITSELAPGSVEVRLRGRDPEFVVTPPPDDRGDRPPTAVGLPLRRPEELVTDADDGATSRVTLRLPEGLKVRIEDAANGEGLSVNAWLVRTLSRSLGGGVDPTERQGLGARRTPSGGQRFTGWTRS